MKKPENDNIGLGLASSKAITVQMGGDIRLLSSKKGLTVFQFKIPVIVKLETNSILSVKKNDNFIQIYGYQRKLALSVDEYLISRGINFDAKYLNILNQDMYKNNLD